MITTQTLIETNQRLNRRCQALEHQLASTGSLQLLQTVQRLNRRCQEAESKLERFEATYGTSMRCFQFESKRASRYANQLREIYQRHRVADRCFGCWFCRLKWRVKRFVWKIWSFE